MTTELIKELCESGQLIKRFVEVCHFFSGNIDDKPREDVMEALLDVLGELKKSREYQKMTMFYRLIRDRQPALYSEEFPFIDAFFIDYYCYNRDNKGVEEAFANHLEDPENNFDMYLSSFNFIIFYRHTDIIRRAVAENIEPIENSREYFYDAEKDLQFCGVWLSLEDNYRNNPEFNRQALNQSTKKYGYTLSKGYIEAYKQAFYEGINDKDKLLERFKIDQAATLELMAMLFLKYMLDRGIPCYIGRNIGFYIQDYFPKPNKRRKNFTNFFAIDERKFEYYVTEIVERFFTDHLILFSVIIWGAVYYNDFLREYGLIDDKVYAANMQKLSNIKGKVMLACLPQLWRFDFMHDWQKPDSISEEEFKLEAEIFKLTFTTQIFTYKELLSHIKDDLANNPDFARRLEVANDEVAKEILQLQSSPFYGMENLDDDFDDDDFDEEEDGDDFFGQAFLESNQPIRLEPKIGRNDQCPCGSGKKYKKCCGK